MELHMAGLRVGEYERGTKSREQITFPWTLWSPEEADTTIYLRTQHWHSDRLQPRVDARMHRCWRCKATGFVDAGLNEIPIHKPNCELDGRYCRFPPLVGREDVTEKTEIPNGQSSDEDEVREAPPSVRKAILESYATRNPQSRTELREVRRLSSQHQR